jgi:hypothetical protein
MTTTTTIDWAAADKVAQRLGAHTRALVARGDADAAIAWALPLSRESGPRGASYFELAVLLGYLEPEPELDEDDDVRAEEGGDDDDDDADD